MDRSLLIPVLIYFLASCSSDGDTCELPPSKLKDFDMGRFSEQTWYLDTVSPPIYTEMFQCWTMMFNKSDNGNYMMYARVSIKGFRVPVPVQAAITITNEGKIDLLFAADIGLNSEYYVHNTDYNTYAIGGGCAPVLGEKPLIAILYTSWHPTKAAQNAVETALEENGLTNYEYVNDCNDRPGSGGSLLGNVL